MFRLILFIFHLASAEIPIFFRPHHHSYNYPINATLDPCHDFYAYTCAPWTSATQKPPYEPVWSPWTAAAYEIKERIPKILASGDATLNKTSVFYRACLTIADRENKYLSDLLSLVQSLGGWPMVEDEWAESSYDWLAHLATVTRLTGVHPLLKIHADLDYKRPDRQAIYVEPGDLIFPQHILADSDRVVELEAYRKWVEQTVEHMYGNETKANREVAIGRMIKFETQLARIKDNKSWNERTTMRRLGKKLPQSWQHCFEAIFGKQSNITGDTPVMVKNYAYLRKLRDLIRAEGGRVVGDYLIWTVVREMSRDTTEYMRKLNFLIDQAILGVNDDVSREHECANKVMEFFSPSVLPSYLKLYVKPHSFTVVTSMFAEIKSAFVDILERNQWLSVKAKHLSVVKVKNIKLNLGFPGWYLDANTVEKFYDQVTVDDDHFHNVLKLKQLKVAHKVARLKAQTIDPLWPSTPFDVNAYYGVLQNSVFIPLGLLQPPFFDPDRPQIYNFGALGSLIGHELSHSLDPIGISADPTGRISKWWPQSDLDLYKKHTRCFKYDEMIGENIADGNGVKISLMALKKQDPARRTEPFFISFAQMWCEISENSDIFSEDEHAPVSSRVQNLVNIREFDERFGCAVKEVCELW